MPRNPDSSRFGKLYQIYFAPDGQILGCNIDPYMLEKSRVSQQQMMERNFHIYYRMLVGPKQDEPKHKDVPDDMYAEVMKLWSRDEYCLPPNEIAERKQFLYLDGGDTLFDQDFKRIYTDVPQGWQPNAETTPLPSARTYEDDLNMALTIHALSKFFDDDALKMILKVTIGTMFIGDISFSDPKASGQCDVERSGKSEEAIQRVAKLWGLPDVEAFATSCHNVEMTIAKKTPVFKSSIGVSKKLRDAMGKTV
jgi:myosin heavy subunit